MLTYGCPDLLWYERLWNWPFEVLIEILWGCCFLVRVGDDPGGPEIAEEDIPF